jgi:hypothetical protein
MISSSTLRRPTVTSFASAFPTSSRPTAADVQRELRASRQPTKVTRPKRSPTARRNESCAAVRTRRPRGVLSSRPTPIRCSTVDSTNVVAAPGVRLCRPRLCPAPDEGNVAEHHRKGAGSLHVEIWVLLNLEMQMRPQ